MTLPMGAVLNPRLSNLILSLFFVLVMTDNDNTPSILRDAMLNWYDGHARVLPWRSKPGIKPDPYHVWMSEVMLQQTMVPAVMKYFTKFTEIWPTVHDLANAAQEDIMREWAGLGYYSRARNLHKCAKVIVSDFDGVFPSDVKTLKTLPGIGDYTSAAIASIAFDAPATVVDGNVERVISRVYRIQDPLPDSKSMIKQLASNWFEGKNTDRPSCFAQSLMDLGATICTPKSPKCMLCPIRDYCDGYSVGDGAEYPKKKAKQKIPEKHAIVYLYVSNGKIGVETRPEKGMLGGMVGFPTSEWVPSTEDIPMERGVLQKYKIRHVFTHFALTLYPQIIQDEKGNMIPFDQVSQIGLPTLFKKVWNMIESQL